MSTVPNDWLDMKVLITVKTYPTPSRKYRELVCTAGVTESGEWIRLYPVPFRYLKDDQQYGKYNWVHVRVHKRAGDKRPDSYEPDIDSLRLLHHLDTKSGWAQRSEVILPTVAPSIEFLESRYQQSFHSLGIVKPRQIDDFVYVENKDVTSSRIKPNEYIKQLGLLDAAQTPPKELEPMPYNFYYKFRCDDPLCSGHCMSVIDWEIFALFRMERHKHGQQTALEKVKDKWLDQICSPKRDTHFIVGTDHRFGHFMILGVYWPPKTSSIQTSLFRV